jgi:hypothetical protein
MHPMAFRFGELLRSWRTLFSDAMPRPMLLLSPAVSSSLYAGALFFGCFRSRAVRQMDQGGRTIIIPCATARSLSCCPVLQQPLQLPRGPESSIP